MDKETIERIENMIRQAVKDIFDENYCPHGPECRFCREDSAIAAAEWYSGTEE
jgi:hypothetical protein